MLLIILYFLVFNEKILIIFIKSFKFLFSSLKLLAILFSNFVNYTKIFFLFLINYQIMVFLLKLLKNIDFV